MTSLEPLFESKFSTELEEQSQIRVFVSRWVELTYLSFCTVHLMLLSINLSNI